MIRRLLYVSSFITLLVAPVSAQDPTLIIDNGRVIVGDGTVLERGAVVIAGERILAVTDGRIEATNARRIDAKGKTVLPGLVDGHVHLLLPSLTVDSASGSFGVRYEVPAGILREFLENGVTTLRSTGDPWHEIRALRREISEDELQGPRLVLAGPVFTAPDGHPVGTICPTMPCRRLAIEVDEPEAARHHVESLASGGVDAIKVVVDDFSWHPTGPVPTLSPDVLTAILDEAHGHGLQVIAHAEQPEDAVEILGLGVDQLAHLPLRGSRSAVEEVIGVLEARSIPVATTVAQVDSFPVPGDRAIARFPVRPFGPREAERRSERLKAVSRLAETQMNLVIGTDWVLGPPGARESPDTWPGAMTINEMEFLLEAGLSPAEVLRAATSNAARALGLSDAVGTLEPDKLADVIVVDGNPLEDLSALRDIKVVVKGGEVIVYN